MGMEQLGGVRVLIDRLGLPPRMAKLVKEIEATEGPLDKVGETEGANEIRQLLLMVDGQNLCACIAAALLNHIELDPEELAAERASQRQEVALFDRWREAAEEFPDSLVLLKNGTTYIAFDAQAERIAGEIGEHHMVLDGHTALSLSESHQPRWASSIVQCGLDVLLVAESHDDDGTQRWTYQAVTEMGETPPVIEQD